MRIGPARGIVFAGMQIRPLTEADVDAVVAFSLEAWAPVFASIEASLGPQVFPLVYPDWRAAQAEAVAATCRAPGNEVWVAVADDRPVGFVAVASIEEGPARGGEIEMVAVDPAHQRGGVASALVAHAVDAIRASGADIAVVATGGDPGHAAARALYEKFGFRPFEQVRYYRIP